DLVSPRDRPVDFEEERSPASPAGGDLVSPQALLAFWSLSPPDRRPANVPSDPVAAVGAGGGNSTGGSGVALLGGEGSSPLPVPPPAPGRAAVGGFRAVGITEGPPGAFAGSAVVNFSLSLDLTSSN